MQRILTVAVALLLLGSGAMLTQREGWLERFSVEPASEESDPLTPWQAGKEHWLVVVVDFEDATTESTGLGVPQAVSLMEGEIADYLILMSSDSEVNFTVYPEVLRAPERSNYYGEDSNEGRDFSTEGDFLRRLLSQKWWGQWSEWSGPTSIWWTTEPSTGCSSSTPAGDKNLGQEGTIGFGPTSRI